MIVRLRANASCSSLINLHLCSGKVDEKATQLHAIASLKVLLDATRPHNGAATSTAAHYSGAPSKETTLQLQQGSQGTTTTTTTTTTTAGTTAGIQELPNGGIAAGLDAGLDSVNIQKCNSTRDRFIDFDIGRCQTLPKETESQNNVNLALY